MLPRRHNPRHTSPPSFFTFPLTIVLVALSFSSRPDLLKESSSVHVTEYFITTTNYQQKWGPSVFLNRNPRRGFHAKDGDGPADAAGGRPPPLPNAREMYSKECKENGGCVRAGSEAAASMRAAATPAVRQSSRNDCGYTRKGSPTAKLASRETETRRRRSPGGWSEPVSFEPFSHSELAASETSWGLMYDS